MKYINLLLVLSVIFCYTGISSGIHHPPISISIENHHSGHHKSHNQKVSDIDNTFNDYKNGGVTEREGVECCYYTLPSAPIGLDFNFIGAFLYFIATNIPVLEINQISGLTLNISTNKRYHPPNLFLVNSSFLF
jgi:hypothetical protein